MEKPIEFEEHLGVVCFLRGTTSADCGPHLQTSVAEEVDQTFVVCNKKTVCFFNLYKQTTPVSLSLKTTTTINIIHHHHLLVATTTTSSATTHCQR
ncbi:hypothetical protein Hanom_Chr11g00989971 [Helianthus anomalus]